MTSIRDEISTIQPDDDEGVEQLEADRRDDEQIHRGDIRGMIAAERRATPGSAVLIARMEDVPPQLCDGMASIDLLVVPTLSFRLLYGSLILKHGRRHMLWFGVTAHPTAEWIARQLTEACRLGAGAELHPPRSRQCLWRNIEKTGQASRHGHS